MKFSMSRIPYVCTNTVGPDPQHLGVTISQLFVPIPCVSIAIVILFSVGQLTDELCQMIQDKNWKVRKEGLDKLKVRTYCVQ